MTHSRKKFPGAQLEHIRSGNGTHLIWTNSPGDRYGAEKLAAEMEVDRLQFSAHNRSPLSKNARKQLRRRAIATDTINISLPAKASTPRPNPNPNAPQAPRADNPKIEQAATTPVLLNAPRGSRSINPSIKAELSETGPISSNPIIHPNPIQYADPSPEQPRSQIASSALPDPRPQEIPQALPTPPQQPEKSPSFESPLLNPFPDVSTSTSASTSGTILELQQQVEYWRDQAEFQSKQKAHQKELRVLKDREIAALRELLATAEEKVREVETRNATVLTTLESEIEKGFGDCMKMF